VVDVGDYPLYLAQRQPLLGVNVTVHGFTHQGQESNASSETFYVNGRPVTTWVVQPKQLYLIQVPGLNQPNVTLITVLPTGKTGVYSTVTLVPRAEPVSFQEGAASGCSVAAHVWQARIRWRLAMGKCLTKNAGELKRLGRT